MTNDNEPGVVVLPAEVWDGRRSAPRHGHFSTWWAARALHDDTLGDEDREMALAAYSRAFDVQMGVAKGPKGGIHPGFPNEGGGDWAREGEASRAAEAAAAPAMLDFGEF